MLTGEYWGVLRYATPVRTGDGFSLLCHDQETPCIHATFSAAFGADCCTSIHLTK